MMPLGLDLQLYGRLHAPPALPHLLNKLVQIEQAVVLESLAERPLVVSHDLDKLILGIQALCAECAVSMNHDMPRKLLNYC
jgi:hypothetical protein